MSIETRSFVAARLFNNISDLQRYTSSVASLTGKLSALEHGDDFADILWRAPFIPMEDAVRLLAEWSAAPGKFTKIIVKSD